MLSVGKSSEEVHTSSVCWCERLLSSEGGCWGFYWGLLSSMIHCCSPADPKKEILRLKINWVFIMVLGSLYAISYTAISSSFHQFMTNPTASSLNQTQPSLVYVSCSVCYVSVCGLFHGFLLLD